MIQYFDKILRGTENEDTLVIVQSLKSMVGQRLTFLNYYKEIPVSYDATLTNVENDMIEFEVHEYQAKALSIERKTLILSHEKSSFRDDIVAEAFYVNIAKKKVILCKFGYAKIHSEMRRFVRVKLDRQVEIDLVLEKSLLKGHLNDLSLGGAAVSITSSDAIVAGLEINIILRLMDMVNGKDIKIDLMAKVIKIIGEEAPFICLLEFRPEKYSQQQISYYINQRQVEIIKELKELVI